MSYHGIGADSGASEVKSPTRTEVRSPTSTSSDVRSPTRTEVRSPTRTEVRSPTRTATRAYTQGNFTSTVTGGAGAGATYVTINPPAAVQKRESFPNRLFGGGFRGLGAGPGPVEMYKVDAPFPWGDDTEIKIPVQEMVNDAWTAAQPKISELEAKLIDDMETEMSIYGPKLVKDIMDTVVTPQMNRELEVAMAEIDIMKSDVTKTLVAVGASLAIAVGLGAWWLRRRA